MAKAQLFVGESINNGNCTSCRAIWSEIKRVITKSQDSKVGMRFVITSLISNQIAGHEVQFHLYHTIHFEIYKRQH